MKTRDQWYTPQEIRELKSAEMLGGFVLGYVVGVVTLFAVAVFAAALWPW